MILIVSAVLPQGANRLAAADMFAVGCETVVLDKSECPTFG